MKLQRNKMVRIPMDDEEIILLYWERDEKAIEETDFKYKRYLFSVLYNILHDRLDCEECINDTYLGAWNAMPPSKPNLLKAFLTTIARRVAIKRYHSGLCQKRIPSELTVSLTELEDFVAGEEDMDATFDAERLGGVISDFVRTLSNRRRYIFISRYYVADSVVKISKDLGISRSWVNKELASIRNALRETLEREGYSV